MKRVLDFLTFREYLTPLILQLLFWGGIAGTLYGSWWLYTHDNWAWIMSITFGPLLTRVIFESLILRFKTYERLTDIEQHLRNGTPD